MASTPALTPNMRCPCRRLILHYTDSISPRRSDRNSSGRGASIAGAPGAAAHALDAGLIELGPDLSRCSTNTMLRESVGVPASRSPMRFLRSTANETAGGRHQCGAR
jgi:hypothetical protein